MEKKKRRGIKGTDVYLVLMTLMVMWYPFYIVEAYRDIQAWPPFEVTLFYYIYPIYELYSLLQIRMVQDGVVDKQGIIKKNIDKVKTWINGKSPIELPETVEIDIREEKGSTDERQD